MAEDFLPIKGYDHVEFYVGNARQAAPIAITPDPGWRREYLRVVAFVQSRKDRRVLSVGFTRID